MIRRLAFIPFEMHLPKDKIDIMLEKKIIEDENSLRYLLTGAVFAYRKAIERGYLLETEKQKELIKDFLEENKECIDLFFDFLLETEGDNNIDKLCEYLDGKNTTEIYHSYLDFRVDRNNAEVQKTFTRRFRRKLPSKLELIRTTLGGTSITKYVLKK